MAELPVAVRFAACPRCGAAKGVPCRALGLKNHSAVPTWKPLAYVHMARRRACWGPA